MKLCLLLFALTNCLEAAAETFYNGFCYGNHWDLSKPKTEQDFKRAFESAKRIKGAGVTFDSARLFSTLQFGTTDDPSSAFDAAISTKTTLFLGIWVGKTGIEAELKALDKAFDKHGKELAELVVGISVGNEDVFRGDVTAEDIKRHIKHVRTHIANSKYGNWLSGIPIGHVDVAANTVNEDVDFVGMTAYPFWHNDSIGKAPGSFFGSLEYVQGKAGNKPVWIAETGWPASGEQRNDAIASVENMETYWKKVGCSLFGKHNVWWFEIDHDNYKDSYDWGLIDKSSVDRRFRIDFTCPGHEGDTDPVQEEPVTETPVTEAPVKEEPVKEEPVVEPSSSSKDNPPKKGPNWTWPKASKPGEAADTTTQGPDNPENTSGVVNEETEQPGPTGGKGRKTKTVVVTQIECVTVAIVGEAQETIIFTNTPHGEACPSPPEITVEKRQVQVPVGPTSSDAPSTLRTTVSPKISAKPAPAIDLSTLISQTTPLTKGPLPPPASPNPPPASLVPFVAPPPATPLPPAAPPKSPFNTPQASAPVPYKTP